VQDATTVRSRTAAVAGIAGGFWGLGLSAVAASGQALWSLMALSGGFPMGWMAPFLALLALAALCLLAGGVILLRRGEGRRALMVGAWLAVVLQITDLLLVRSMGSFVYGTAPHLAGVPLTVAGIIVLVFLRRRRQPAAPARS
jgi:hypothetical protein